MFSSLVFVAAAENVNELSTLKPPPVFGRCCIFIGHVGRTETTDDKMAPSLNPNAAASNYSSHASFCTKGVLSQSLVLSVVLAPINDFPGIEPPEAMDITQNVGLFLKALNSLLCSRYRRIMLQSLKGR